MARMVAWPGGAPRTIQRVPCRDGSCLLLSLLSVHEVSKRKEGDRCGNPSPNKGNEEASSAPEGRAAKEEQGRRCRRGQAESLIVSGRLQTCPTGWPVPYNWQQPGGGFSPAGFEERSSFSTKGAGATRTAPTGGSFDPWSIAICSLSSTRPRINFRRHWLPSISPTGCRP